MKPDPMIERSGAQRRLRIELMRFELKGYGYSVVRSDWLQDAYKRVPVAQRLEAMAEAVR
jgi:hypothetical protein